MTIKKLKIHCGACCFLPKFKKFEATETYCFLVTMYIARHNEVKLYTKCLLYSRRNKLKRKDFFPLLFWIFFLMFDCQSVCTFSCLFVRFV